MTFMATKMPAPKTMLPGSDSFGWKRAFAFLVMLSVLLWRGNAMAQLSATLEAKPVNHAGACPAVITFTGAITASKSERVTYIFTRSDGKIDTQPKTLKFKEPGTQIISTTWTLGDKALPYYSGWEAIQIIKPATLTSNEAKFQLRCEGDLTASLTAEYKRPGTDNQIPNTDDKPPGGGGNTPMMNFDPCLHTPDVCAAKACGDSQCLFPFLLRDLGDPAQFRPESQTGVYPTYKLIFGGLSRPDLWTVETLDPAGTPVADQQVRTVGAIAVTFRPSPEFAGRVGEYKVVFKGARRGLKLKTKPLLEVRWQDGQGSGSHSLPQACEAISISIGQLMKQIESSSNKAALKQLAGLQAEYSKNCRR